jgi:hypothetical protein
MSVYSGKADITTRLAHVSFVPILLQKSAL